MRLRRFADQLDNVAATSALRRVDFDDGKAELLRGGVHGGGLAAPARADDQHAAAAKGVMADADGMRRFEIGHVVIVGGGVGGGEGKGGEPREEAIAGGGVAEDVGDARGVMPLGPGEEIK